MASNYPDMVITNWDSNKGDYIFYNTESSVGVEEQGGVGCMGAWRPGSVAGAGGNELTVGSRQSAVGSQRMNCRIEIYTLSGQMVLSKSWPSIANELTWMYPTSGRNIYHC